MPLHDILAEFFEQGAECAHIRDMGLITGGGLQRVLSRSIINARVFVLFNDAVSVEVGGVFHILDEWSWLGFDGDPAEGLDTFADHFKMVVESSCTVVIANLLDESQGVLRGAEEGAELTGVCRLLALDGGAQKVELRFEKLVDVSSLCDCSTMFPCLAPSGTWILTCELYKSAKFSRVEIHKRTCC